jgi:hypothetical protein
MRPKDLLRRGLERADRALAPGAEPPLGAHIVTPRWCYSHHGIYVGRGRVVHYGGLSRGLRRGPVEEVTLAQFARGRALYLRPQTSLDRDEIVRRARLRLGEDRYRVFTNNCEHFCEWCTRGEHRSYQVEEFLGRYEKTRRRLAWLLTRALPDVPTSGRTGRTPRARSTSAAHVTG